MQNTENILKKLIANQEKQKSELSAKIQQLEITQGKEPNKYIPFSEELDDAIQAKIKDTEKTIADLEKQKKEKNDQLIVKKSNLPKDTEATILAEVANIKEEIEKNTYDLDLYNNELAHRDNFKELEYLKNQKLQIEAENTLLNALLTAKTDYSKSKSNQTEVSGQTEASGDQANSATPEQNLQTAIDAIKGLSTNSDNLQQIKSQIESQIESQLNLDTSAKAYNENKVEDVRVADNNSRNELRIAIKTALNANPDDENCKNQAIDLYKTLIADALENNAKITKALPSDVDLTTLTKSTAELTGIIKEALDTDNKEFQDYEKTIYTGFTKQINNLIASEAEEVETSNKAHLKNNLYSLIAGLATTENALEKLGNINISLDDINSTKDLNETQTQTQTQAQAEAGEEAKAKAEAEAEAKNKEIDKLKEKVIKQTLEKSMIKANFYEDFNIQCVENDEIILSFNSPEFAKNCQLQFNKIFPGALSHINDLKTITISKDVFKNINEAATNPKSFKDQYKKSRSLADQTLQQKVEANLRLDPVNSITDVILDSAKTGVQKLAGLGFVSSGLKIFGLLEENESNPIITDPVATVICGLGQVFGKAHDRLKDVPALGQVLAAASNTCANLSNLFVDENNLIYQTNKEQIINNNLAARDALRIKDKTGTALALAYFNRVPAVVIGGSAAAVKFFTDTIGNGLNAGADAINISTQNSPTLNLLTKPISIPLKISGMVFKKTSQFLDLEFLGKKRFIESFVETDGTAQKDNSVLMQKIMAPSFEKDILKRAEDFAKSWDNKSIQKLNFNITNNSKDKDEDEAALQLIKEMKNPKFIKNPKNDKETLVILATSSAKPRESREIVVGFWKDGSFQGTKTMKQNYNFIKQSYEEGSLIEIDAKKQTQIKKETIEAIRKNNNDKEDKADKADTLSIDEFNKMMSTKIEPKVSQKLENQKNNQENRQFKLKYNNCDYTINVRTEDKDKDKKTQLTFFKLGENGLEAIEHNPETPDLNLLNATNAFLSGKIKCTEITNKPSTSPQSAIAVPITTNKQKTK